MFSLVYDSAVADPAIHLAEWRRRMRWSQSELARRSGLSRTTIIGLEKRTAKGVEWKTLVALAAAFDVEYTELFTPPDDPADE